MRPACAATVLVSVEDAYNAVVRIWAAAATAAGTTAGVIIRQPVLISLTLLPCCIALKPAHRADENRKKQERQDNTFQSSPPLLWMGRISRLSELHITWLFGTILQALSVMLTPDREKAALLYSL